MPLVPSIQNTFTAGLKTEFTGLNFPENAATETQNCIYTLIGDVLRREGIDFEANPLGQTLGNLNSVATSSYEWKNVGGDGLTEILVIQVGTTLSFFKSSSATIASPLSAQLIPSTVQLLGSNNNTANIAITECQYADGNGFLFVFHPNCDPIYCVYDPGANTITSNVITINIRDFIGIPENISDNFRPSTLNNEHLYNLVNQGWSIGATWSGTGNANGNGDPSPGQSWTIPLSSVSGTAPSNGNTVRITIPQMGQTGANNGNNNFSGHVTASITSYTSSAIVVTVQNVDYNTSNSFMGFWLGGNFFANPNEVIYLELTNQGFINTWLAAVGNSYPSNSDIWWLYKDSTDKFNPGTQFSSVQQNVSPAPKGAFLLNPWNQDRSGTSSITGLTSIKTTLRPSNGCWFAGRVWYTGVNASVKASGDAPYYTWTENIYFSQIITNQSQFGKCFQNNDPTTQDLFEILSSDGGVITIQGSGTIYKLFPLENGLLVFAANGIWFITGNAGIGFTASDYAIRKISNIQSISSTSFVNVNGYPMFWNEEGIYYVTPSQFGAGLNSNATSFQVTNLCLGTILTDYQNIPKQSKKFVRGDYDRINYIVQWCYRSTNETDISNRYFNDSILNFNVVNKAFYPYTITTVASPVNASVHYISDIKFIQNPGGTNAPPPMFKYITPGISAGAANWQWTFSEEKDSTYVDWKTRDGVGLNYTSDFTTGYKLTGKGLTRFNPVYVYVYLRNTVDNSYRIQGVWDYALSRDSGRWTGIQTVQDTTSTTNFGMSFKRHKIRGHGMVLQIKVQNFSNQPFDIMGWTVVEEVNQSA
jgi:hypothetical protein